MKKVFVTREFTVCTREDSDNLVVGCQLYTAEQYNNDTFKVNNKKYTVNEFHKAFTVNIP